MRPFAINSSKYCQIQKGNNSLITLDLGKKSNRFGLVFSGSDDFVVVHVGKIALENGKFEFDDYNRAATALTKALRKIIPYGNDITVKLEIQVITPENNLDHAKRVLDKFFSDNIRENSPLKEDLEKIQVVLKDDSVCPINEGTIDTIKKSLNCHFYSSAKINGSGSIEESKDKQLKIQSSLFLARNDINKNSDATQQYFEDFEIT
jgi:hypothetical protein